MKNPFEMLFGGSDADESDRDHSSEEVELESTRKRIAHQLAMGELEDHYVTIEVEEAADLPCLICFKARVWSKWV